MEKKTQFSKKSKLPRRQIKRSFPNQSLKAQPVGYGADKLGTRQTGPGTGIAQAVELTKEILGKEGNIVKANKTDKGWEVEVEVIEQSEHMKKIGIPKPVYDKNIYRVILDQNFELVSYERKGQKPSGGSAE